MHCATTANLFLFIRSTLIRKHKHRFENIFLFNIINTCNIIELLAKLLSYISSKKPLHKLNNRYNLYKMYIIIA